RHVHAVGGRAVHAPHVLLQLLHAQRHVQGERIAGAGAVAIRRDDQDLVAGIAQTLREDADARGIDAVIVADQYAHESLEPPSLRKPWPHDTGCRDDIAHARRGTRHTARRWGNSVHQPPRPPATTTMRRCSAARSDRCASCRAWTRRRRRRNLGRARAWPNWTRPTPGTNSCACSTRRRSRPATRCATAATTCPRACSSAWPRASTPRRTRSTCIT